MTGGPSPGTQVFSKALGSSGKTRVIIASAPVSLLGWLIMAPGYVWNSLWVNKQMASSSENWKSFEKCWESTTLILSKLKDPSTVIGQCLIGNMFLLERIQLQENRCAVIFWDTYSKWCEETIKSFASISQKSWGIINWWWLLHN